MESITTQILGATQERSRPWYRALSRRQWYTLMAYGKAAVIVSTIYLLGICAVPFFPETIGKPLPE
jgi:hypothetical protein